MRRPVQDRRHQPRDRSKRPQPDPRQHRPAESSRHREDGANGLPGAVHDLTAARIWGIIAELAACGLVALADKGYIGEDDIRTPYRGQNKSAPQKQANRAHARLRAPGKRANAQLKSWPILRKLRCCPWHAGRLAKRSTSFKPARPEDEKAQCPSGGRCPGALASGLCQ